MNGIYMMWGILLLLFIVVVFAKAAKESKMAKRDEAAIDPMFRPRSSRPATRRERSVVQGTRQSDDGLSRTDGRSGSAPEEQDHLSRAS
jgi:hypothetical protein